MARIADPNLRAGILSAARDAFITQGFSDTRIADIAERAGIAPATIYLYYKSKDELAMALGQQVMSRVYAAALPRLAQPDIAEGIASAVHVVMQELQKEREVLHVLHLGSGLVSRAKVKPLEARELAQATLAQMLAARMDAGELQRYDPQVLAQLVAGLVEWTAEACLVWGNGDLKKYERELVLMLQRALLIPKDKKKRNTRASNRSNRKK